MDEAVIAEQVREIVRDLPIWLNLLRFVSLALAVLLAAWIMMGRSHPFVQGLVLGVGVLVAIWMNIAVYRFAGAIDLWGMLAFVPLGWAVYRLWTRTRTGF